MAIPKRQRLSVVIFIFRPPRACMPVDYAPGPKGPQAHSGTRRTALPAAALARRGGALARLGDSFTRLGDALARFGARGGSPLLPQGDPRRARRARQLFGTMQF